MFPKIGAIIGAMLPSTGSTGRCSPASTVLSGTVTSCRPSRRTSLPSLGDTSVALVVSLFGSPSAAGRSLELVTRCPTGFFSRRRQDLSSSWAIPIIRLHMLSRPRQDRVLLDPWRSTRRGPRSSKDEGSHEHTTFEAQLHGFRTRCLRFAVPVTRTPRKTRFRLLVPRYRTGFSPAGLL
jgi:hypothetical protein